MTTVAVSTPSRLHFGLLRLHESPAGSFGGFGMMIDRPRVEVEMAASDRWRITGPGADRAADFAKRALAATAADDRPAALDVRIHSLIPPHRGLGAGTQLALAIAAGVRELLGLPPGTAAELAAAVGRGARSGVGSHGFVSGGVIFECGRTQGARLSELTERIDIPAAWRVVLVSSPDDRGLSGEAEQQAFEMLPPISADVTERLRSIVVQRALPAARAADVDAFGDAVFEYGRLAGECFAPIQGGGYASPDVADCVSALRQLGARGVGQSSWGPTVFAIIGDEHAASDIVSRLRTDNRWANHCIDIAAPDNRGAVVAAPRQP